MNFYMFDAAIIKTTRNLRLSVEHPQKWNEGPMINETFFSPDGNRWEPRIDNGYPNVFFDPEKHCYRCYYSQFTVDRVSAATPLSKRAFTHYEAKAGREVSLAYAESQDGRHWVKPQLGLVDFEGSTANNLILHDAHGASVFYDAQETESRKKYKMLYRQDGQDRLLVVAFSADGIHFSDHTVLEPHKRQIMADSHNFAFRDPQGGFVLISRHWDRNLRVVTRMFSNDFIHWSRPRQVFCGQSREDQIYSMPVFWFDGFYMGLPSIFHDGDSECGNFDCVDCELAYSADTIHWHRVAAGTPFIRRSPGMYPNGGPDCGCIYASPPIAEGDKLLFYYMGGNGRHSDFRETSLLCATLKMGRFASLRAGNHRQGFLETAALECRPSVLTLDAECEKGARISVQVTDVYGQAIDGYTHNDCSVNMEGERCTVRWQENTLLPQCKNLRLQFLMNGMRLYSFACDANFSSTFQLGLPRLEQELPTIS